MTASKINIVDLFADQATISQLNVADLSSNSSIRTTISSVLGDSYYTKEETASYVTTTLSTELGSYYTKEETASYVTATLSSELGNYYNKQETASYVTATLSTSLGNYYTKVETASLIDTTISSELGNYYNKTETNSKISTTLSVALNNYYNRLETASYVSTTISTALGGYYTKVETASVVASMMSSKNRTYIQTTDPGLTNTLVVGDWWCKADLSTWRQMGALSWRQIQEEDLGDYMGGETLVWDGSEWVPRSNIGEETRTRTMILQTQSYVSLLAESVSTFEDDIEVLQGEIDVTSSMITAEVRRLTADKYTMVSGIYITASGIDISGSQYVKIASGGYFQVTTGDFGINTQTSSDTDYVMWSGADTASTAPFRLRKNGELYITKLYSVDDQGAASQVNFGTNLWKLNYRTVKTFEATTAGSVTTLTLGCAGGDLSVNFNSAASVYVEAARVARSSSSYSDVWTVEIDLSNSSTMTVGLDDTYIPLKAVHDQGVADANAAYTHLGRRELGYMDHGNFESVGSHDWYYK